MTAGVAGRGGAGVLAEARARVVGGLTRVGERLAAEGMPTPEWRGQLIRPLVGYAAAAGSGEPGVEAASLWRALAAVQLAHEASLLHDDVLDGAASRRGEATLAARRGVATALVEGDHLLTAAYRVASWTGSAAWMEVFARGVERTVAGEKAQAGAAGSPLTMAEYEAIVLGKSGELLGSAMGAAAALRGEADVERWVAAGRRLGLVYQMLDDLLDYCPHVDTGKPALGDYRRGLWTWPLAELALEPELDDAAVAARLRRPGPGGALPLRRCANRLQEVAETVRREVAALLPGDAIVPALLAEWTSAAGAAAAALELPPTRGWRGLMAEHAKSFRFASRLFPAEERRRVMGVYAWCRYTDDLVDGAAASAPVLEARLDAWLALSRRAYEGAVTGSELADEVMGEMRRAGVPFGYAEALIEGMRMDVRGTAYGTMAELYRYTYRVASVVGLWVTELFGIRDPWMLERAASLGHAMQLTNILRDVGEDLRAGRLYLPTSWLRAYGLGRADLEAMMTAGEVTPAYASLIEALLRVAEREYDDALPAIRRLPDSYRRPVAVAADVYRGIHEEIRRAGYDNLRLRAHTSLAAKLRLGAIGLWRARPAAAGVPAKAATLLGVLALLAGPGAAPAQAPEPRHSLTAAPRTEAVAPARTLEPAAARDRAMAGIGRLWVLGVEDEAAVEAGVEAVARAREGLAGEVAAERRLLRAYEGAFLVLRAKHGGWPPERLRNLSEGFGRLDAVVSEAPDAADLRYIRLMSGFHVPGIFGRRDEVAADLAALVDLLPRNPPGFPPALVPEAAGFLLEHAAPSAEQRARLEALVR